MFECTSSILSSTNERLISSNEKKVHRALTWLQWLRSSAYSGGGTPLAMELAYWGSSDVSSSASLPARLVVAACECQPRDQSRPAASSAPAPEPQLSGAVRSPTTPVLAAVDSAFLRAQRRRTSSAATSSTSIVSSTPPSTRMNHVSWTTCPSRTVKSWFELKLLNQKEIL